MQQAHDFAAETETLAEIITPDALPIATAFKGWTVEEVIRHLHVWTYMADQSLRDETQFQSILEQMLPAFLAGKVREAEVKLMPQTGAELITDWRGLARDVGARWAELDPKTRVQWAGPSMSVRSSMTARQMETWSHGQAVFDALGMDRQDTDRIKNIAVLGVNTFGWMYQTRGLTRPDVMPRVILTAPSGEVWNWGDGPDEVRGSAVAFCQIVSQTRNAADTDITTTGPVAAFWMENAQCFAGPSHDPPARGHRYKGARA